jgi:hypothetical protein
METEMLSFVESGLERILLEVLEAQAATVVPPHPGADGAPPLTDLDIAVLRLRWLGEQLSERGGVYLMRAALETVVGQNAAGPWLRSIADVRWQGIGEWTPSPPPPSSGAMPY